MKRFATALCLILLLIFIWGNSLLPTECSSALSDWLTTMLGGEIVQSGSKATSWLNSSNVRTAAHFLEFAVCGFVATKYVSARIVIKPTIVLSIISFGILVAVADETIQMLNDRFSSVEDIWIDVAGFMVGFLISHFFFRTNNP